METPLLFPALSIATLALTTFPLGAAVTVEVATDLGTTGWSFGAPYVRDTGRTQIGVSTVNPFLAGIGEENSYFIFNLDAGILAATAGMTAVLRVETEWRSGVGPMEPFFISAHRVTGDPAAILPNLSSGAGSYAEFRSARIGASESTVRHTLPGLYEWDVTALTEEWRLHGSLNFPFAVAMTARLGNPADTDESGFFAGFVNKGESTSPNFARLVFVPEPTTTFTAAGTALLFILHRRRSSWVSLA